MKKIRYLRQQKDRPTCGPIAIINALKWAGCPVTGKDLPDICIISGYSGDGSHDKGTVAWRMDAGLKAFKNEIKVKVVEKPTVALIERELKKGNSFILRFMHNDCGHYTNIIGKSGKSFLMTNYSFQRSTVAKITRRTLEADLNFVRPGIGTAYWAVGWVIEKRRKNQ